MTEPGPGTSRWRWYEVCWVAALVVTWVLAKVDFFTRYDARNPEKYLAGHWPYWAMFAAIGLLGWLLARRQG